MPRAVPMPASKAAAPVPAGRGKAKAVAPPPRVAEPRQPEEKEKCPLCVEEMDETDLTFEPCPCGYRVCLFCFEKLKLHCASTCPNCRRVYGSQEALELQRANEALAAQAASESLSSASSATLITAGSGATSSRAVIGAAAKPAPNHVRKPPEQATPTKRAGGALDESQQGLPSNANWASATQVATVTSPSVSRNQSIEIERPPINMDQSAWPSLAHSNAAPAAPAIKQKSNDGDMQSTRRSSSMASSSFDREASSNSLDQMSQDPPLTDEQLQGWRTQAQQLHLHGSHPSTSYSPMTVGHFHTAQVTTTVNGYRRAVNIPLSFGNSPAVDPYPEAPALVASMQQAVQDGSLTSIQAAEPLVDFLKQKEVQKQNLLMAGRAPPGFGSNFVTLGSTSTLPGPISRPPPPGFSSQLNNVENPVVSGPPSARCTPIHSSGSLGSIGLSFNVNHTGLSGLSGASSNTTGTYSMWSGLPGIALATTTEQPLSLNSWGSIGQQKAYQSNSTAEPGSMGASTLDPAINFTPAGTKPPPPGFGPSPYSQLGDQKGYRPYQPIGTRYNPLEHMQGMSGYRPQLGTGL